ATNSFELVLREDKHENRYLFVLNPHTRESRQDDLTLAGRFSRCTDLGIGSGVPVPAYLKNSETRFTLRLHPVGGTEISLRGSTPEPGNHQCCAHQNQHGRTRLGSERHDGSERSCIIAIPARIAVEVGSIGESQKEPGRPPGSIKGLG